MISTLSASLVNGIFFFLLGWIGANYWPEETFALFSTAKQGAALTLPVVSGLAIVIIPKLTLQSSKALLTLSMSNHVWLYLTILTLGILTTCAIMTQLTSEPSALLSNILILSLIFSFMKQSEAIYRAKREIHAANKTKIRNVALYTFVVLLTFWILNNLTFSLLISLFIMVIINVGNFIKNLDYENKPDYQFYKGYFTQFYRLIPGVLVKELIFFLPFMVAIVSSNQKLAYTLGVIYFFMRAIEISVGGISPHLLNYAHDISDETVQERRKRINLIVYFSLFSSLLISYLILKILNLDGVSQLPLARTINSDPIFLLLGPSCIITVNLRSMIDYSGNGSEMTKIYICALALITLVLSCTISLGMDQIVASYYSLLTTLVFQSLITWRTAWKLQESA